MTTEIYRREIVWDREMRDYAMYLNQELVGFGRTYHECEVTLDQLVCELMTHNYTVSALDGGSDPDAMAAENAAGEPEPTDPLPDHPGEPYPGVDYEEERQAQPT